MTDTHAEAISTPDHRCVTLRRAGAADYEAVAALLRALKLPTDGVADWVDQFWVAEHAGAVVGVAGMERYGERRVAPLGGRGSRLAGAAASAGRWWTGCSKTAAPPVSRTSTCSRPPPSTTSRASGSRAWTASPCRRPCGRQRSSREPVRRLRWSMRKAGTN